mmetsp:Transcript_114196/g.286941  ORF Transcript_114196/g.286941 Transcript_114196/m.286941 type:complete len:245 (-) Transcript_114196:671-1405(-)
MQRPHSLQWCDLGSLTARQMTQMCLKEPLSKSSRYSLPPASSSNAAIRSRPSSSLVFTARCPSSNEAHFSCSCCMAISGSRACLVSTNGCNSLKLRADASQKSPPSSLRLASESNCRWKWHFFCSNSNRAGMVPPPRLKLLSLAYSSCDSTGCSGSNLPPLCESRVCGRTQPGSAAQATLQRYKVVAMTAHQPNTVRGQVPTMPGAMTKVKTIILRATQPTKAGAKLLRQMFGRPKRKLKIMLL